MKEIELLSPAGSFDCAISAFSYGADAIYLGLNNFSARADALNFTSDELKEITELAHGLNKKVYVAINTLIQNSETQELFDKLALIDRIHTDGIIIQDFAVVNLIKKYFPNIVMHASTQMAVHNIEGAKFLKEIGFKRIVLARELSFTEIEEIIKNCDIEVEVFIHGALCYSYSGLCMYSSFKSGESANRGKCTYPCRKIYNSTHPYSMKDLCLNDYVLKLKEIGVSSLKIEGRKKTPLYVAATTDYYRKILDGKDTTGCLDNIKRIFARPYTDLHFNGKNKNVIDKDFSGPRGLFIGTIEKVNRHSITFTTKYPIEKHDGIAIEIEGIERPFGFAVEKILQNGKPTFTASKGDKVEITIPDNTPQLKTGLKVYCTSSQMVKSLYPFKKTLLEKQIQKIPLDISFYMDSSKIEVSSNNITISENGNFEKSTNPEKMEQGAKEAFSKLGDSPFVLNKFDYNNKGFFAPISLLNNIRRNLIEQLTKTPEYKIPNLLPFTANYPKVSNTRYVLKIDNPEYLSEFSPNDINEISELMIDINSDIIKIRKIVPLEKIRCYIPPIQRVKEISKTKEKINHCLQNGIKKFCVSNIGMIKVMQDFKIDDWIADYYLYTLNNYSTDFLLSCGAKRITLSPEDSKTNIQSLINNFASKIDLIVYSDIPLFIADNCNGDCKNCHDTSNTIIRNCRHYVFSDKHYCIADKSKDLLPLHYRLDFCYKKYTPKEVLKIFQEIKNCKCPPNSVYSNFLNGFK